MMAFLRILAVGFVLGAMALVAGCDEDTQQPARNDREQEALNHVVQMKADFDAERAAARRTATQPAAGTGRTAAPLPFDPTPTPAAPAQPTVPADEPDATPADDVPDGG